VGPRASLDTDDTKINFSISEIENRVKLVITYKFMQTQNV